MAGPILLNQVIAYTPSVEKIHTAEQQIPDQGQRLATQEAMMQTRVNTETVQKAPRTDESKIRDRQKQSSDNQRRSKKRSSPTNHDSKNATVPKKTGDGGGIVDVMI
ncbi:MAG: hypothetical protein HQK55_09335 [Deltaproteobacteria bacterium]|nr:hypothetical protein [Deltaproteobacteria bacterium]